MPAVDRTIGSKDRRFLTGSTALDVRLVRLKMTAGRRVVSAGMRKQAQHLAKVVKADIPSRYKTVRKAIGWRSAKLKYTKGEPGVKVGGAVGKKSKKQSPTDRSGRPGVGIGVPNVDWWFLGTDTRTTGTRRLGRRGPRVNTGKRRMNRGSMPPQIAPMKDFAMREKSALVAIMLAECKRQLKKEVAKLKGRR